MTFVGFHHLRAVVHRDDAADSIPIVLHQRSQPRRGVRSAAVREDAWRKAAGLVRSGRHAGRQSVAVIAPRDEPFAFDSQMVLKRAILVAGKARHAER